LGVKTDCLQNETDAFFAQLFFNGILNPDEKDTLSSKIRATYYPYLSNQLKIISYLWSLQQQAMYSCQTNVWDDCTSTNAKKLIYNWVANSPEYKKECGIN